VRYESTGHTNDPVRLYAMGSGGLTKHLQRLEGHWYPCTRMIDNTQLFHAMTAAAGIPQPPSLTVMVNRPEFCPPRTGNGK
jgi:alkaline phosphatase